MISSTGAQTVGPTSGGKVTPFNTISTTPQQVLAGNPSRTSITFHNPGTVDLIVAPTLQANGQALTITTSLLGGGYRVFANGGDRTIAGECQTPWQAISVSGTGNFLTVSESNV